MAVTTTLNTALTALRVNQLALQVTSQNIANVNTPSYARVVVDRNPVHITGFGGGGVEVEELRRAANRFFEQAAIAANSTYAGHRERAALLERAQAAYGDPGDEAGTLGSIDTAFSSIAALAADPSSSVRRTRVVTDIQHALSQLARVSEEIGALRIEADTRIGEGVGRLQSLLDSVARLNIEIERTKALGGDITSAQNQQAKLVEEISEWTDLRVLAQPSGGVELRTMGGEMLVGSQAARIGFQRTVGDFQSGQRVTISDGAGLRVLELRRDGGALSGLLRARDEDLPRLADEVAGLAAAFADTLNRISNDSAPALGALAPLRGRDTGLSGADRLGFSGSFTLGLLGADGSLAERAVVDFNARTITLASTGVVTAIPADATIDQFVTALNTALTPAGVPANFAGGRLSIGDASDRIVIREGDSNRAGRGFSHFFGLNDLIVRQAPTFYETGMQLGAGGADLTAPGFSGDMIFRIADRTGRVVRTATVTLDPASINASIAAINTQLAPFGAVQAQDGRLSFVGANGHDIAVTSDSSRREGGSQLSFSQLFGVGLSQTAMRARDLQVNPAIAASPNGISTAQPDLTALLGTIVLRPGDGRGASAMAAAQSVQQTFAAAGGLPSQRMTLRDYAAVVGASAGQAASEAAGAASSAEIVKNVTVERRRSVEAVDLDEELTNLELFQQSYAAAARLVEASKELFDILLRLV